MNNENKIQTSSDADILDQIVKFLEYEEAMTVDPTTQRRIRNLLQELGIWESENNSNV